MHIYALYGTSGTGKSTSAIELAHRLNIEAIIDDGILIYQGRKVAGTSAKYEKTKIQAVKRAIFHYADHAEEVRRVMQKLSVQRLLILGTSKRMVYRIAQALQLPDEISFIPIETIKPQQEIEAAKYIRETQGKHVIPIARVEVEKDFFQKIIASAQQIFSAKKEIIGETTVVHPSFSGGRILIHEQVLRKIVQVTCLRFPEVLQIQKTVYTFHDLPRLRVGLTVRVPMGTPLIPLLTTIQQAIHEESSYCLNISPASVDVQLHSVRLEKA